MVIIVMIFILMLVLARIMTFLVMLDVFMIGDTFEVSLELTLTLTLRQRTNLHVDVATSHLGFLIDMSHGQQVFLDPSGQCMTQLLVRHLTPTELKLNAHFMTFSEEVFRMSDFDFVIVRVDADTEFQLLHLATFLVLVSFLLVLLLGVFVLAVIDNFAHRRVSGSSHFDKIKAALFGHTKSH